MICLRCGYCCKNMMVMIVDDSMRGLVEDNIIFHDGKDACKHLQIEEGNKFKCAIHHYLWYKKTPCFSHGQIEQSEDTPCRMGQYLLHTTKRSVS